MRTIISKQNSTKPERKFAEYLKRHHIPFKHRVKICGREIDFLIDDHAIEIDGHVQDVNKNEQLVKAGYIPIHFTNKEIDEILKNAKITWQQA